MGNSGMISADAIRGYIDVMVLSLVRHEPSYAYELAQRIAEIGAGEYEIKQTSLYSALKRLEAAGFLESFAGVSPAGKSRTYYRINHEGRELLENKINEWQRTKTVIDRFMNLATERKTP